MGKAIKISIIGAGSGQFTLGVLRDLCLTRGLWGGSVSFMDINQERLDAVHNVATRYAAEFGAEFVFEKTLDRRQSLQGADFVINTAMVGGWGRFEGTREIAQKYGYTWGFYFGRYDQLQLFMDIIHDMERICPDAWYIQSANPVFDGTTLITRKSAIKAVGLCHGQNAVYKIARVLGVPEPEKVQFQCYGVNHFIWLTKFRYQGQDLYPVLDEWVEKKAEAYWASPECGISDDMGPKAVDVYKRMGLFPVGDTVTPGGGSSLHYYHTDKATEERWKEDPRAWFGRHIRRVTERAEEVIRVAGDPSVRVTELWPPKPTHESIVPIMDAIANDKPAVYQVNIANRGCVPGIPDDVAVDIPALVSAAGMQGLRLQPLPRRIMCHVMEKIVRMERSLEAFESGDKNALLEVLLAHPQTRSIDQARGALEGMLALPLYKDMAEYYG